MSEMASGQPNELAKYDNGRDHGRDTGLCFRHPTVLFIVDSGTTPTRLLLTLSQRESAYLRPHGEVDDKKENDQRPVHASGPHADCQDIMVAAAVAIG